MRDFPLTRCNKSLTGAKLPALSRVFGRTRQQALERIPELRAVDRLVDKFVSKLHAGFDYLTSVMQKSRGVMSRNSIRTTR
jgi:hypothetical protein